MPADLIAWYAVFVLSATAHEAAHALAAYVGGDPTAYHAGQVSLNPLPHIQREPFGMVLLPLVALFSAGWCLGYASTPTTRPGSSVTHAVQPGWRQPDLLRIS